MKHEIFKHFKDLLSQDWRHRPKLNGPFTSIGSDCLAKSLEARLTEGEVWDAVKNCDGNKAPELDEFTLVCFQKCWKVLKADILQFFNEFHENGKLVRGINSSFITLIPKVDRPARISNYRPISLIGSLYKILAKVLTNRLKQVVHRLIGEAQSAFLGGRNILDGVLIANEVVDWWKRSRKKGLFLKLGFEKAFDSVSWECLFFMMNKFGFRDKWRNWIKECLTSARISVLVNGSPTPEFIPEKGFRQRDLMSHFLFNLVAKGLNMLLQRARSRGLITGAVIGHGEVKTTVTHLQFADDTIIFCEADGKEVVTVKRILRCFQLVSSLKINFHKSLVYGV